MPNHDNTHHNDSPWMQSLGALVSDFYVNQRLNLKMDLPSNRETVMSIFDRLRKDHPELKRFRRGSSVLALESDVAGGESSGSQANANAGAGEQIWAELRRTSVRSGTENPRSSKQAYALHSLILEIAPYFLSISPLDIDYLELLWGFDIITGGNHDAIVFDALVGGSPLARLIEPTGRRRKDLFDAGIPVDCQPILGVALSESADLQAHFEIRTRTPAPYSAKGGSSQRHGDYDRAGGSDADQAPLSIYLIIRRYGAVDDIADLLKIQRTLRAKGDEIIQQRVIPHMINPIREVVNAIGGGDFGPNPGGERDR